MPQHSGMKKKLMLTGCLMALVPALAVGADGPYWDRARNGWHFYEPTPKPERKPELPSPQPRAQHQPTQAKPLQPAPLSAEWIRQKLPEYRDRAIDDPTPENVELVAYLERLAMDKSEQYAKARTRVSMMNPALDETARSPISSLQQTAAKATRSVAKEAALATIAERAGLMYFYSSTCPYCARQEPILERVQANIGLSILPISLDGGPPPTWRHVDYVVNQHHAAELGVMVTPTLVVADTVTGQLHNLAAGLRTDQEIETRLLELGVSNGWISQLEYENAVRGEPRRFITDGLVADATVNADDPLALLQHLREASTRGGGTPWIVAPNQGQ